MSENTFVFRKLRTYGEIINGVFVFTRLFKKQIIEVLFRTVLPLAIVATAGVAFLMNSAFTAARDSGVGGDSSDSIGTIFGMVGVGIIVFFVVVAAFFLSNAVHMSFFALAVQKGTDFTTADVRALVRKKIFPYIGMMILVMLSVYMIQSIGSMFIMGILQVVLGVFGAVLGQFIAVAGAFFISTLTLLIPYPMFVDNVKGSNCVSRVFRIIKGHFWRTFWLDVTLTTITYNLLISLTLPIIATFILVRLYMPLYFATAISEGSWVVILLACINALVIGFGLLFFSVVRIAGMGLQYTNLMERHDAVGLAMRVNAAAATVPPQPVQENLSVTVATDGTADSPPIDSDTTPPIEFAASDVTTPDDREKPEENNEPEQEGEKE